MKFKVGSVMFGNALKKVSAVIQQNAVLPVLENFHFTIINNQLLITATDLETVVNTTIPVESLADSSKGICVPAKVLTEYVKTLKDEIIIFVVKDQSITLLTGNGKYKLVGESEDNYPRTPIMDDEKSFTIPSNILLNGINKTLFAASNDDLRPAITGLLFEINNDGLTLVATDAHRLVKYTYKKIDTNETDNLIVPKKSLQVFKSMFGDGVDNLIVNYTDKFISFSNDTNTLICRLIDARYPDYKVVIPEKSDFLLTVDSSELKSSMRRVNIFGNHQTNAIKLNIQPSEVSVSAENIDFGFSGEEAMPAFFNGEEFSISFNSKMFSEILNNVQDEELGIHLQSANKAAVMVKSSEEDELLMLLMPLMTE